MSVKSKDKNIKPKSSGKNVNRRVRNSELAEKIWAVISPEGCISCNLTYSGALRAVKKSSDKDTAITTTVAAKNVCTGHK